MIPMHLTNRTAFRSEPLRLRKVERDDVTDDSVLRAVEIFAE